MAGKMKNMTKTELEKLKKVLERQLHDLQHDFGREMQNMGSPALADINDQATLESERSFELRIKDRERKLIGKVQEALKKIHEGSYGICESCGEPIGIKRLLARPVTSLCINCKAEMEAEERREENLLQQTSSSSEGGTVS
jgi:DnaK suppressor protein